MVNTYFSLYFIYVFLAYYIVNVIINYLCFGNRYLNTYIKPDQVGFEYSITYPSSNESSVSSIFKFEFGYGQYQNSIYKYPLTFLYILYATHITQNENNFCSKLL